jgi:transcriptional regulator with XRE-family HTH domain
MKHLEVNRTIKRLRKEKGYTQTDVAEKLGISQNAYSKIELGYSGISIKKLFQFAELFETTPQYLLGLDDSGAPKNSSSI